MAKTVTLTVKVDDTDFKRFIANFNAFSTQIKTLNQNFSQINTTIQKTTASSNALVSTMKSLWQTTKSLSSTVASITTHFIKWSALIGGIGAMLAMGGGLFGIERLAASILQKRRLTLGLGGDYGKIQAAQIFGKGILDNPQALLQNIAMGKAGSPDQLRSMISLGIPFGTKMTPEEIMPKYLDELQRRLKGASPNTELMIGRAFGAESMGLSSMDIMRLKNMTRQELKDLEKEIAERAKELTLSKEAQKGWADLDRQFAAAKAAIEGIFGEKLASLTRPLSDLSKSIIKLVQSLMDMPIVEKIIKQLTKWINQLSDYLKSNTLEDDLKKFSKEITGWVPILKEFKDALLGFVETTRRVGDVMGKIWNVMKNIWKWSPAGMALGAVTGTGLFAPGPKGATDSLSAPATPAVPGSNIIIPGGGGAPATRMPPLQIPGFPLLSPPVTPGSQSSISGFNQFASTAFGGGSQFASGGGRSSMAFMGGGIGGNSLALGGGGGSNLAFLGGGRGGSLALMGGGIGGNNLALMGGSSLGSMFTGGTGGGGGADKLASWGKAAGGAAPTAEGRSTWAGLFGFYGSGGGGASGKGGGPLDANNWQSNRTASIVIRNTPGSNPYMTATGMAG
jgi:methyl-accepting chemotaxis protein